MLAALLMAAFTAALVFNQIRGLDVHCGCFSTQATHGPANLWTVMRDICFLALSVYLLIRTVFWPRQKTGTAFGQVAATAIAAGKKFFF